MLPRCLSSKESACQCRRPRRLGCDPWVGRSRGVGKWQLTRVFLLGKSHGQRSPGGSPQGCKRVQHDWDWARIPCWSRNNNLTNSGHQQPETTFICIYCSQVFTLYRVMLILALRHIRSFPAGPDSKQSACNAQDPGLTTGSGRSSAEGSGNPFLYSCLENTMDRGTWQATAHGVKKSWTQLSD